MVLTLVTRRHDSEEEKDTPLCRDASTEPQHAPYGRERPRRRQDGTLRIHYADESKYEAEYERRKNQQDEREEQFGSEARLLGQRLALEVRVRAQKGGGS